MARLAALFDRATAAEPDQRAAIIAECEDAELRRELISLLAADEGADGSFDALAAELVAPGYAAIAAAAAGAHAVQVPELEAALGGSYRIERELGGGAMSQVFLAEETALGRKVVIKVLPPALSVSISRDRFRREIQVAAQLQHSHVVPLLASGASGQFLWYTMPFVAGESLRARLARDGPLPIREAVKVWRDVVDALAHAHARNLIHRDIKPANILLGDRNALVADFGIARAIEAASGDADETAPGAALGTPGYMAPEQIVGEATADHRIDLYSSALVMYEMLAGHGPAAGRPLRERLAARIAEPPPPIDRLDCPPALAALVLRCLARDPAARPPSAEALLAAIESIPARPGAGRRRRLRVLGGGVAVSIAAGLVASTLIRRGAAVAPAGESAAPLIAVLPLGSLDPKGTDGILADGLTEELTAALGKDPRLRVVASTSVRSLAKLQLDARRLADSLRASYLLEGSLQTDGATVRARIRLIDAKDGSTRWSEQYDRERGGLLALQEEIAQTVAIELGGRLTRPGVVPPARYRPNLVAYDWYLRGKSAARATTHAERLLRIEDFRRAIAADSNFAAAYAGLAWLYLYEAGREGGAGHRVWYDSAESVSRRAVAIDSTVADAHSALGWAQMANRDLAGAEATLQRAIAIDRGANRAFEGLARVYMQLGRPAAQLAAARQGLAIDPYSTQAIREMALALNMNHRCPETLELLQPLKKLSPPAGVAGIIRGQCLARMERWPEAIAEFRWTMEHSDARTALSFLGYALARGGQAVEAEAILADLLAERKNSHGAFGVAVVYTGLRNYDRAFEWLAKSVADLSFRDYIFDPLFEDLHRDPRFATLFKPTPSP